MTSGSTQGMINAVIDAGGSVAGACHYNMPLRANAIWRPHAACVRTLEFSLEDNS